MQRTGIIALLVLLYIGAAWIRFESLGDPVYPYYKGVSGTNFRQTHQIIEDGTLPAVDHRAAWPDGFEPARVKPNGIEHLTGFAFRLAGPFTDMPEQRFVRGLTVLIFSLTVFTFYVLTYRLWLSRAAGVFAAFLATATVPVIQLTNGREFLHSPFAVVLISLHLIFAVGYSRKPSMQNAILAGLAGIALLATWEAAALYIVFACLVMLMLNRVDLTDRRRLLAAHLVAMIAAASLLPHLQAQRLVVSWPTILVLMITAHAFFGHRLPRRIPGLVFIAGGTLILTFIFKPVQNGGIEVFSPIEYWYQRLRYLTGKPNDPSFLSNMMRIVWTHDHSFARGYTVFAFFLPLIFLVIPAFGGFREIQKLNGSHRSFPLLVLLFGVILMLLDRQAGLFAALLVFPVMSAAMVSFQRHLRTRLLPVAIAVILVTTNAWAPTGRVNATYRIGAALGLSPATPDGFPWVSIGNADRGLVRYVLTRTSSRNDVFLATPDHSSLINTFVGRSTVLAPGIYTRDMVDRVTGAMALFYAEEDDLFDYCTTLGVTYVLYSIDLLLDTSTFSPLYLAGLESSDKTAAAYRMHFAPETLRWFHLVFENDNYRLFRVTSETKPVFITDHPPVYQASIMRVHGDDFESFYTRIVDILLAYQSGVNAQSQSDDRGAIPRFRYCLDQAPLFTKARLGEGDSQLRLGDYEASFAAYRRVIEYAPDDKHALYYGALSLAYLGRGAEAIPLLEILLSSTADRDIRSQALELKAVVESGRSVEPPRPPE